MRLVEALVLMRADAAGIDVGLQRRGIKARVDRARDELGIEESRRITVAFAQTTGPILATVKRSAVEARPYAMQAAIEFTLMRDEHGVQSTSALGRLASAAQWAALERLLLDQVFADPTKTDALKMAATATSAGRLQLLTALEIEERARKAREQGAGVIDSAELQRRIAGLHREPANAPQALDEQRIAPEAQPDAATRPSGAEEPWLGFDEPLEEPAPEPQQHERVEPPPATPVQSPQQQPAFVYDQLTDRHWSREEYATLIAERQAYAPLTAAQVQARAASVPGRVTFPAPQPVRRPLTPDQQWQHEQRLKREANRGPGR